MFRVTPLSGNYYAFEMVEIDDELKNIQDFISTGDVVILCQELSDLEQYLGIKVEDIEMVR